MTRRYSLTPWHGPKWKGDWRLLLCIVFGHPSQETTTPGEFWCGREKRFWKGKRGTK